MKYTYYNGEIKPLGLEGAISFLSLISSSTNEKKKKKKAFSNTRIENIFTSCGTLKTSFLCVLNNLLKYSRSVRLGRLG